jgi:acyl-[acyl carrier protein]--UDP-N-acetylglucosamine O-acyltransferase
VVALNAVGLRRRTDLTDDDRRQVKEAFKITYRSDNPLKQAIAEMEEKKEWGVAANRFREFVEKVVQAEPPFNRGLCSHLSRSGQRR